MENEFEYPVLYILMRTDLESMNPGKAVAQGAHAANQFVHMVENYRDVISSTVTDGRPADSNISTYLQIKMYDYWSTRTSDGFGTTICLSVDDDVLHQLVPATRSMGMIAGITHDPSYPIRDGGVTHFIPLDSCGYIFGEKEDLSILLRQFNLMP